MNRTCKAFTDSIKCAEETYMDTVETILLILIALTLTQLPIGLFL